MNDTPLSQRERDELRQTVTAGAARMRRSRTRRIQALSGAAAVVLVGAVVTAVTLGTLMPAASPITTASPVPSASHTPSPTPSSTPSASPTSTPTTARSLFDGDCGAMIGADVLTAEFGVAMPVQPKLWQSPQDALAGGLECVWWDGASYATPSLTVYAYPASSDAPESALTCTVGGAYTSCSETFVQGGVWVSASASASAAALTQDGMQRLIDALALSVSAASPPRAAERAVGWWPLPTCDELATVTPLGDINATMRGSSASTDDSQTTEATPERATAPYETSCLIDADAIFPPSGELITTQARVEVVPGGGQYFDQITTSQGAEQIQIPGVPQAVLASDNARWEGYAPALVVRDGPNVIVFRGNIGLEARALAPLAAPYLAFLDAQLP
ncbi:hypothetical protein [Microbacterium sp. SORGH_AS_0888]|uniref:hypothetical protein n=1 Tax=Microbacterium sp. SORGH_AS_0888 TaxID=3041791 RepID=UPI0027D87D79|nr:hypothetical protein [Microbacterium sp. SORGH_AS_0888]